MGHYDPIAYKYDADYHCPGCAFEAFGIPVPEDAVDSENNPVGVVAPWDEWQQFSGEVESLVCGTCGGTIETYEPSD